MPTTPVQSTPFEAATPVDAHIADEWLTDEDLAKVRAHIAATVGPVKLTLVSDIFTELGL